MQTDTRSENVMTNFTHPDFDRWSPTWDKLNDTIGGGGDTVKDKGTEYLPATSGMKQQWGIPMPGIVVEDLGGGRTCTSGTGVGEYAYDLYKFRAIFYEYPAETARVSVGRLTYEDPAIDLPPALEPMKEQATASGDTLNKLIEDIFKEQVTYSRCGILADFASESRAQTPYICIYGAQRVLNWKTTIDSEGNEIIQWVILDESGYDSTGITWKYVKKVRICALDEAGDYFTAVHNVEGMTTETISETDFLTPPQDAIYPNYNNNKAKEIPFVFVNATNTNSAPELPIMNNLVNASLAIYRGEADYRQALFMQGQATPTFKGMTPEESGHVLLGASGSITSNSEHFEAKFMEVSGAGLSEMRQSQDVLHSTASGESMKLIEGNAAESGEALKQRTDSQTISLTTLVSTQESALKKMFRLLTEWGGLAGETEISLNREFNEGSINPAELKAMMESYMLGAPITLEDIHEWAREGGLTETEFADVEAQMQESARA